MAHNDASTAAQPDENASCIRVTDAETGTPYYISAVFRSDADAEECYDLRVMDLTHAWAATGATLGHVAGLPAATMVPWLRHLPQPCSLSLLQCSKLRHAACLEPLTRLEARGQHGCRYVIRQDADLQFEALRSCAQG
jgi:hypothetical protein